MSSTKANWQPNGQNHSEVHSALSQIIEFLAPDGQMLPGPEFTSHDVSAQFWQFKKTKILFVLCPKIIDQNFILDILGLLSKLQSQYIDLDLSKINELSVEVHLLGLKFEESFTSKLRFLRFPCQLSCVSISRNEQRDIILVKDFKETLNHDAHVPKSQTIDSDPALLGANPLSAQELSEFVQFGTELRKLRESV